MLTTTTINFLLGDIKINSNMIDYEIVCDRPFDSPWFIVYVVKKNNNHPRIMVFFHLTKCRFNVRLEEEIASVLLVFL